MATKVALGFRVHSGWAAAVAVAGTARQPTVVLRKRIEILDPAIAGSKQPYHTAAEMSLEDAAEFVEHCASASRKAASRGLDQAMLDLNERGYEAACAAVLENSAKALPPLDRILASHALIHTAEGEFYRAVVRSQCERGGLALLTVIERELWERAARTIGHPEERLRVEIDTWGKRIGPPWTQDQKLAAAAAWMALAGALESAGSGA